MPSQGFYDWLNAGKPYTLIRPAAALQKRLRGYGLVVYDYPNDAHLKAARPEDHTSFSETSWPIGNARWRAHALDVMPRTDEYGNVTAAARAENADIARQLIRDRDAGVPGVMWIKYVNWTDEAGVCRQIRWTDYLHPLTHEIRSSSDKGHIHISGRSDCATDDRADDYDPIARMRGDSDVNVNDKSPFGQQFSEADKDYGLWLGGTVGNQLQWLREDAYFARQFAKRAATESAALRTVIEGLAAVIERAGGSADTAAILAGVDERLARLAAEQRDAVADLGEGGAAQVRADTDGRGD
jgi:hypothetical protein